MKRLYFLSPDLDCTKNIVAELKSEQDIDSNYIHVIGREQQKMEDSHIHAAGALHTTDLMHSIRVGAVAGLLIGTLIGFLLIYLEPAGLIFSYGAVLGFALFGVIFGAWSSSMIGVSIPSPIVAKYAQNIAAGEYMVIVDVDYVLANSIQSAIRQHHPTVVINETVVTELKAKA